jgi:hypothetical protein
MVGTAVARGITSDNSDVPGRGRTPIRAFGIPHVIAISLGALVVGGSLGERKRRARRLALSVSLRCPRSHAPKCDRIPPTPGHAVGCAGRIPFALPYPAVGKHAWMVPAEVYPWTPRPLEVGMASSASRSSGGGGGGGRAPPPAAPGPPPAPPPPPTTTTSRKNQGTPAPPTPASLHGWAAPCIPTCSCPPVHP